MRIKLLVSLASADDSYGSGSIVDMPDDEAKRFLDAGMAILLEDGHAHIETATAKHPHKEKATKK